MVDNKTESGNTINVLKRFNVYQEVLLAFVYRALDLHRYIAPVYFYCGFFFFIGGVGLSVLCLTTYVVSDSVAAAVLCFVVFLNNLDHASRVVDSNNLRENCSMPFFWMQSLVLCIYLRGQNRGRLKDRWLLCGILLFTFLFSVFWQFNQFLLLIQAGVLYVLAVLRMVPLVKLFAIYAAYGLTIVGLYVVHFGQTMILGSIVASFLPAAAFSLLLFRGWTHSGGILAGLMKTVFQMAFTLLLTIVSKMAVAYVLNVEADNHIYKFFFSKFGFDSTRDFESRLYLCHAAFTFLSNDFFVATSKTALFPLYMIMLIGSLFVIGKDLLVKWCDLEWLSEGEDKSTTKEFFQRRVDLAFLTFQSAVFGLVSVVVNRLQYIWVPQMCVLASCLLGDFEIWKSTFSSVTIRRHVNLHFLQAVLIASAIACNGANFYPKYRKTMDTMMEFWDPDTVELMHWIGNSTAPQSSFTGSMQLMAAVKSCTGRRIANHPHFEDKALRERTKELYQIYGKRSAQEVYSILKRYDVNYVILENSICYEPSKGGCALREIIDLENRHVLEDALDQSSVTGLVRSPVPRFCRAIMELDGSFSRYFRLIFKNGTFKVYQLL